MSPASRPRWSCSLPSVAEISCEFSSWNEIGRAPNFSWFASVCAVSWVNPPVMRALPAVMA